VTIGVQNAVYTSIKTLHKLGAKRILIPEIFFGIYLKIPKEFEMEVATYALTADFGVDLKALEKQISADDIVLLNSPANPTGRIFSAEEQQALGDLLNRKLSEGFVISDEIYGRLVYDGEPFISFSKFFDRTIVVDGISKSGAVAGLRVGWIITRNSILAQAFTSNNATIISAPPTANQYAAIPVVKGETKATIQAYNEVLKKNRDLVEATLTRLNIPFVSPRGSFYIFPNLRPLLGDKVKEFCLATAKAENGVVVIPGIAFGAPDYIRISLATDEMEEGMRRLEKALLDFRSLI
ncbi:MAG: pyridoxal phosphate-dependent aminotransferase, partial [Marinilabiliaceae bacterium]|nr:pyridoxal phosphate-dependent aminotransferase [Marinilabiliaceae bacterium]